MVTQPDTGKRRRPLPIGRLFPNMVTLMALCCGMSAIRFAFDSRWELAVTLIIAAVVLDGMDGRLARLLKATSQFGAQLDSLADFLSFGVAPAVVAYLWVMHDIKGVGWGMAMFFASCAALRLARFNTVSVEEGNKSSRPELFFTGVPSPAGAGLVLLPMLLSFQLGEGFYSTAPFMIPYVGLMGILMASRVPTFSLKRIVIRHELALPVMVLAALLMTLLVVEPWLTLCSIGAVYIASIPVGIAYYPKWKKAQSTGA